MRRNKAIMKLSLLILLMLVVSARARALGYPAALPNHGLGEEIAGEEDRIIPKTDVFSGAVDGQAYLRTLGEKDFYHGIGYWVQARMEARPQDYLRVNSRSIFLSGSVSGGYTSPTSSYHLFGFSGEWPQAIFGGKLEGRGMDLERMTVGAGLFIEERETVGALIKWSRDGHSIRLYNDGTGGLLIGDDLYNVEARLFDGYIGFGALVWTASDQSNLKENREALYYLFSEHQIVGSNFGYFAEAARRGTAWAGMVGFRGHVEYGRLNLNGGLQGRSYANRFAENFAGGIEHLYVSYDQYDKRFTNAINIFAADDNVMAYSAQIDADLRISDRWSGEIRSEAGRFDYAEREDLPFIFYRAGLTCFPVADRQDGITFFVSNKVLTDSYAVPPYVYSYTSRPLFLQSDFVGAEAFFRF